MPSDRIACGTRRAALPCRVSCFSPRCRAVSLASRLVAVPCSTMLYLPSPASPCCASPCQCQFRAVPGQCRASAGPVPGRAGPVSCRLCKHNRESTGLHVRCARLRLADNVLQHSTKCCNTRQRCVRDSSCSVALAYSGRQRHSRSIRAFFNRLATGVDVGALVRQPTRTSCLKVHVGKCSASLHTATETAFRYSYRVPTLGAQTRIPLLPVVPSLRTPRHISECLVGAPIVNTDPPLHGFRSVTRKRRGAPFFVRSCVRAGTAAAVLGIRLNAGVTLCSMLFLRSCNKDGCSSKRAETGDHATAFCTKTAT